MSDKFTPGDWHAECVGSGGSYDNPVDVYEVTNGHTRIAEHLTKADAALCAQAPTLLATVRELAGALEELMWRFERVCVDADGATDPADTKRIATARGVLTRAQATLGGIDHA